MGGITIAGEILGAADVPLALAVAMLWGGDPAPMGRRSQDGRRVAMMAVTGQPLSSLARAERTGRSAIRLDC